MSDGEVIFERRGAIGLITLNRPKALNALTLHICIAMKEQLEAWAADSSINGVVVRGAGERAFCAGGDIRSLYESGKAGTTYALDFYRHEYRLNATIKHYPKPYIALLRGIAMGGGVGVSIHGSHRIADPSTVFAMPETGIGLFPDVGGSYFLPRMPGEIGMYLALTGTRLTLEDCLYVGFATHALRAEHWPELIDRLASGAQIAPEIEASCTAERGASPAAGQRARVDVLFGQNSVEHILAVLDVDSSPWARETAAAIRAKSPTATKLAFRELRAGKFLDFDECMRMEFRMVNRVVACHDFYEGVRATIIDKDQNPLWRPASLEDVSDCDIDAYFAPLGGRELEL